MEIKEFGKVDAIAFQDAVKCLQCSEVLVKPDIYYDKKGTYVSCPHCEGSFDVDVYVIERPINDISINGNEQAVNDEGKILGFGTEKSAKSFVKKNHVSINSVQINLI